MNAALINSRANEILKIHKDILSYVQSTFGLAVKAGRILQEVKASLDHGEWLPWIKNNLPNISESTVQRYMRISENERVLLPYRCKDVTEAYRILEEISSSSNPSKSVNLTDLVPDSRTNTDKPPGNPRVSTKARKPSKKPTVEAQEVPAEARKDAAESGPKPEFDDIGTRIPNEALPFWRRKDEVQEILTQLSRIKCTVEKAKLEGDCMYGKVSNGVVDNLSLAYNQLLEAKPHVVCTDCQGRPSTKPDGCSMCGNKGLISKYQADTQSRREVLDIRMKAAKAGARA